MALDPAIKEGAPVGYDDHPIHSEPGALPPEVQAPLAPFQGQVPDTPKWFADAIAKARLAELVAQMPQGADTPVGEKGLWVSGGQRQRIALARAFYFDAEVLVMDESTSALDAETADEIIGELQQLKGRVTIVVITHQEALLGLCNKVYQVAGGRIACVQGA